MIIYINNNLIFIINILFLVMIYSAKSILIKSTIRIPLYKKRNYYRSIIKMMPEGPEVKCLVDNLNYDYNNDNDNDNKYKLISSSIISGRYIKNLPIGYSELISNLPLKLYNIKSKGKFIYFIFQNNITIWQTLGLTGGMSLNPNIKHIRYTLTFINDNNIKKTLYYYDQRNFGTLKISFNNNELIKKLDSIGPCWINNNITFIEFLNVVKNTKKKSKKDIYLVNFLMNQKKTSGIGNYIISEVLYDTKIWPYVKISKLKDNDWYIIYNSIKNIINLSYKSQKNYNNNNIDNNYENYFSFKVYSQKYCPNGYKVIREEGPHNRTIHYVPELQNNYKDDI